jgi:hypothetical protein
MFVSESSASKVQTAGAADSSFVTRNAATTVGCAVIATVPVLGTVSMIAGAPGTTALCTAIGGAGIYIGHRQANDLPLIPGRKSQDAVAPAATTVAAEPAPAAA